MSRRLVGMMVCITLLLQCTGDEPRTSFTPKPLVARDLADIKKRGYLEAIIDNNSVSYFIYKGRPMGFEYELLQRFAESLKVQLRINVISSIDEAIDKLNKGEGDILAFPLTVMPERASYMSFTQTLFETDQVLVQKKPTNWRRLLPDVLERKLLRNPIDLINREVHVKNGSAFIARLDSLSRSAHGVIHVREDSVDAETESLIQKVATGEIDFTVTDRMIAEVNQLYFPNIDIQTSVSDAQPIAWAVRLNSPELLTQLNQWLEGTKKRGVFQVVYDKYFKSPRYLVNLFTDYDELKSERLSPFDDALKKGAASIGWDWRLLASLVFQESNFDPRVESWAGAVGLMQVMPETGQHFGIQNLWDPSQNIVAGVRFIQFLDEYWKKTVPDENERKKFVLASYNVGLSHIIDAQKLALKYGRRGDVWDGEVDYFMLRKSNPRYYRDAVAVAGYCRCDGPVIYVRQVLQRYEEYKIRIAA